MCGIAGALHLHSEPISRLKRSLEVMNHLQRHRGPDGEGTWVHPKGHLGMAHRRLSIIDLETGQQPMWDESGNWITYNGEIYNYIELREEIGKEKFLTQSDTEVILRAYKKWGPDCLERFRGMFAFALWDAEKQMLFCARDRFGIKPFYYATVGNIFYFASEAKALLPFVPRIETNIDALKDYLAFQFCLAGKTLFQGIQELLPAHVLTIKNGATSIRRYWEVYYRNDYNHTAEFYKERLRTNLQESIGLHMRSDVPVGAYLSGGLDSSTVTSLARGFEKEDFLAFIGKFSLGPQYDETAYARELAHEKGFRLLEADITSRDFAQNIRHVIYHLDYPVAGPGSFSQFMVSKLAAQHRKVVLGGQGGDEIFGGYTRYLMAYFEQCIKAAIDGTMHNGNFVVTYESIIPNLASLKAYKPMLKEFWSEGLFEDMDRRYFKLINRTSHLKDEIRWDLLGNYSPFETFQSLFHGNNVGKESYFDLMTHFDFKTLLPALLQVEDRVSMAHGLESRVPLLDHTIVELAARVPSDIKFKNGDMKHWFKNVAAAYLPKSIIERKDKMGFPTPFVEWAAGDLSDWMRDVFSSQAAQSRGLINNKKVMDGLHSEAQYGRKIWGLLSLELWQQEFHDRENEFKNLLNSNSPGLAASTTEGPK